MYSFFLTPYRRFIISPKISELLFLTTLLLFPLCSFGQQKVDSLTDVSNNVDLPAKERMEAMYLLSNYYSSKQADSIRYWAEKHLTLARTVGDKASEGRALQSKAVSLMRKGGFLKAMPLLKEALGYSQMSKDEEMIGKIYYQLAACYGSTGSTDSAFKNYQRALKQNKAINEQKGVGAALGGLGLIAKNRGEFEDALSYYQQAIDIFEQINFSSGIIPMNQNIAFIHVIRGEYDKGLEFCHKSLEIIKEIEDKNRRGNVLGNIGLIYHYKGEYDEAATYQEKSLEAHQTSGDKFGLAGNYGNLGMIYQAIGNAAKAVINYEQSLELKRELGDRDGMIKTLINLGNLYTTQEDLGLAITYFKRSLRLSEELGHKLDIASSLDHLTNAYYNIDEDSLALSHGLLGLRMAKELNAKKLETSFLVSLGNIYTALGQISKSMKLYAQGGAIAKEIGDTDAECRALIRMAQLALDKKSWTQAASYAKKGLALAQEINNIHKIESAAHILWKSQAALGEKAAAFANHQLYIQMRDSILSEENQRQAIRFEFKQKALTDSLENASQLALEMEKSKRSQNFSYFLIGGMILLLFLGIILFYRFRITRRQKYIIEEEKLKLDQANTKLKELDNVKTRFFTNISHEFRTPLTVVGGMIQQIKKDPQRWLEEGILLTEKNVNQLLSLTNQILDLRKLESGSFSLKLVQDDICSFLKKQTEAFRSLAEERQIHLVFESDQPNILMDFDPDKVLIIHSNLLSNALKFTEAGGQVVVALERTPNNQLQWKVTDNGIGISAEKLPFIFDRFYQASDSPSVQSGAGTGIGLSLSKELVQFMGGSISVQSRFAQGTSFEVVLPIRQEAQQRSASKGSTIPIISSKALKQELRLDANIKSIDLPSMLIIEDNPDLQQYLYSILVESYRLLMAKDGEEGIEMALRYIPDLIICDLMMPKKNGYEVCDTLKSDERSSHIPIVLLTAKADQDSKLQGLKKGADAYLTKPFHEEELLVRLDHLLMLRERLQARYTKTRTPLSDAEPEFQLEDAFIQRVREAILDHLDDSSYRPDNLIKDMGVSRTQMYNKLKALTGKSTSHFVRSVRLEKAKELLMNPELQISEIAYSVGFSDPQYFSRVFKRENDLSPKRWRDQHLRV